MNSPVQNTPEADASTPPDPARQAFTEAWAARRHGEQLWQFSLVSVATHVFAAAILPMIAHESARLALTTVHVCAALLLIVTILTRRESDVLRRVNVGLVNVFLPLYVLILAYAVHALNAQFHVLGTSAAALAFSVFGILFYPGSRRAMLILCGILAALGIFATAPIAGGITWTAIYIAACCMAVSTRFAMDRAIEREARREYDFRLLVAPAHVVRRSLHNSTTLMEAFRTELKFCVCIASDWRDYQALSSQLSPSQLTMTLNEYYTLCVQILSRCLPEGNYYTDWIADELFVVLYADGTETEGKLIDAALQFSVELLQAKEGFSQVHQLPKGIDIGISAGEALLGLMGPDGHKKATALGSVPGRARRLQTAGKLLRHRRGQQDRIVFGRECLMRIKSGFDVVEMTLGPDEGVRDVPDRELFFIEPGAPVARLKAFG